MDANRGGGEFDGISWGAAGCCTCAVCGGGWPQPAVLKCLNGQVGLGAAYLLGSGWWAQSDAIYGVGHWIRLAHATARQTDGGSSCTQRLRRHRDSLSRLDTGCATPIPRQPPADALIEAQSARAGIVYTADSALRQLQSPFLPAPSCARPVLPPSIAADTAEHHVSRVAVQRRTRRSAAIPCREDVVSV